jgi:probable HAF family extracellular repeat protein
MYSRTRVLARRRRVSLTTITIALLGATALLTLPADAAGRYDDTTGLGLPSATEVVALSADGRIAVINGYDPEHRGNVVYYWDGRQAVSIGGLGRQVSTIGLGISGDGSTIVGISLDDGLRTRAFRWNATEGIIDLGTLRADNAGNAWAFDASHDASVIVGQSHSDSGYLRAFAWLAGADSGNVDNPEMFELNTAGGFLAAAAHAVSADGRYAAGQAMNETVTESTAVRWNLTRLADMGNADAEDLGSLGGDYASASDISADGRVVVGSSSLEDNVSVRAFRWVEGATGGAPGNGAMFDLGVLGDHSQSAAHAVSADGNVVVGNSSDGMRSDAFRWEEETGMISVVEWLENNGVNMGEIALAHAGAVSADGSVVAGYMFHAEDEMRGYIARVGEGGTGLMDVTEYHESLFATTRMAEAGQLLSWLPMNGAHHRPLMLQDNLAGTCVWATGDAAWHAGSGTGMGLAEMGICGDIGDVRIGVGIGGSQAWQALPLGGSSRLAGNYIIGEVDWQPDGTPLLLSVTGLLGGWGADITRGYSNGADTAYSNGSTSLTSGIVRLRADWLEAATWGATTINPWASVALGRSRLDGYTESGGPFPASFDARDFGLYELRLGVTAETQITVQTTLSATLELAHRGGTAPGVSGTVPGLFDFNLGGGSQSQTWVRAGLDLSHQVTESVALNAAFHAATNGADPSISGSLGLKAAF